MSEESQILFMQTRLIRLASEEWGMPLEKILYIFDKYGLPDYIEKGYGIFHCEGDEAVLEDITELLERKGMKINAGCI
ncbi:MAG: DUF3791 domain-containing protein [Eubacteriales bacterium]|nr:DUF3791 domain-containing protein [Eubacteriales bacterium]